MFENVCECVIEWLKGEKVASVTMPTGTRIKGRLLKLAETHSEVEIVTQNKDGSILAHVPASWIKINPPQTMTEEQRMKRAEQMKHFNETRSAE